MAERASCRPGGDARLDGRRVLLLLATSTGGVGVHVRSLAAGLTARGAEVRVAAPPSTQDVFGFARHEPVGIGATPHPVRDVAAVLALRRLARDADVVHAHGLRAGSLAVLAARTPPVVVSWHNPAAGRAGEALERLVARRAAVSLAASDDLAARARAAGGRDVRLAPVAPPPLVPSGRDPGLGRPLVLAVGRLHPQKGYDVLLEALPLLGDAVVAVAGDGPLAGELATAAPQVRWLGRRDDVADLYAAADVVVLPSQWEARSLTAQEALRAGRPLVAAAVGGLPALVRDGAVLVPPGDPAALAAAVRRLLDVPDEAAAIAARGRAVAATWPDEADAVAQAAALYAELVGP
ncbi:MAG TPA: glycosyltransferase family 4 protein [Mycobacteriales bacterium]|nr:glycosyltransferase family 4 protein [Mycobacteriales bacterium]